MRTKNVPANMKSPEKHKHSVPFYISPSLFDNKRLKQKRAKLAALCQSVATYCGSAANTTTTKTDYYYSDNRKLALLHNRRSMVTIDLLSDDEQQPTSNSKGGGIVKLNDNSNNNGTGTNNRRQRSKLLSGPPPLAPIQGLQLPSQAQPLQHFIVYPGGLPSLQLSNASNIRLIPLPSAAIETLQQQQRQAAHQQEQQQSAKRKRKSHQPRRHSQPTIVNNESIVLTDDSDDNTEGGAPAAAPAQSPLAPVATAVATTGPAAIVPPAAESTTPTPTRNAKQHEQKSPQIASSSTSPSRIVQVDEEVTVSLVPRSATGSCTSKAVNNKLFPMLPDETTVHTVIANRIYELSLTKLREGLGIDDVNGQPKTSPTTRKGKTAKANGPLPAAAAETQQQQKAAVSLKLSSDLSISLISDDEDDNDEESQQQHRSAEKLRQLAPHLAVQQVRLPADTGQLLPRRQKLG